MHYIFLKSVFIWLHLVNHSFYYIHWLKILLIQPCVTFRTSDKSSQTRITAMPFTIEVHRVRFLLLVAVLNLSSRSVMCIIFSVIQSLLTSMFTQSWISSAVWITFFQKSLKSCLRKPSVFWCSFLINLGILGKIQEKNLIVPIWKWLG